MNDTLTFTDSNGNKQEITGSFSDYNVEFFETEKYGRYFTMNNGDATSNGEIMHTSESTYALEGTTHKIGKYRLCEKITPNLVQKKWIYTTSYSEQPIYNQRYGS